MYFHQSVGRGSSGGQSQTPMCLKHVPLNFERCPTPLSISTKHSNDKSSYLCTVTLLLQSDCTNCLRTGCAGSPASLPSRLISCRINAIRIYVEF